MAPPSIHEVFARYAAVDNAAGTDKGTTHAYLDTYEELFAGMRDRDVRLLEIGVYSGASLAAWADYFPRAAVVGVDVDVSRVTHRPPRTVVVCADGTLASTAEELGTFDVVVEDGSHAPLDQVASLRAFAPRLNPGGVYVAEDLDLGSHPWLADELRAAAADAGCSFRLVDLRARTGRFDDVLAVVAKPE